MSQNNNLKKAPTLAALPMGLSTHSTLKPPLHGSRWMAITGKPLAATAGAMIFQRGGNAVDAACTMIAATSTLWDQLSWGGETQALVYNPHSRKVTGINALGVAPTGATAEFFRSRGLKYPPALGPLAAVTPGTPGGVMVMLAEYGRLSLADVLGPAIELADGYPIEAQRANSIEEHKAVLKEWPDSRRVLLPHSGGMWEAPEPGEMFRQTDLAQTLRKLLEAEAEALAAGSDRRAAIYAAYDRFYRGDIAEELARGVQEQGGLITADDLANWQVHIEEPVVADYKGIAVHKLTTWVQGPVLLQALNMLEGFDLKRMGYNSPEYIHTLYQAMNLAYADRDFYYGDPYYPPEEPVQGLLSKEYARARAQQIRGDANDPDIGPGDPYPFQGETNPHRELLARLNRREAPPDAPDKAERAFHSGTTSVIAADAEGWVVSVTPSGGWIPAVIAGHTGIGLSQRMQSFVLDPAQNPFNVVEPGKRPRATLTPSLALKDGKPYLAFAVEGGDAQDQYLLQFFLNVVEFDMTVQEAVEAPSFVSYQMHSSFDQHDIQPGKILVNASLPDSVRAQLARMGYTPTDAERTSGPVNAIQIDARHGTFWGGSSHHGEDYGIAW